ncbi:MAG: lysoplasmalogenase [Anaerolineae bacterium]
MLDFLQQGGWMLVPALALGIVNWIAVARKQKRVEYVVKPGTLILVIVAALLLLRGAEDTRLALFFVLGLCFSLAGDVFLMLPGERFFIPGLIAFLIAHVCYIIGLNPTLPPLGSVIVLVVVAVLGVMLYTRIAASLRQKGEEAMRVPVGAYAIILSLMLFSAWATLFRPAWPAAARFTAIVGATLFFASDSMLAWNKFVAPSHVMHVLVMVTYHLAQFALAATIALAA